MFVGCMITVKEAGYGNGQQTKRTTGGPRRNNKKVALSQLMTSVARYNKRRETPHKTHTIHHIDNTQNTT